MDHPEPISKRLAEIPQCRKGLTLDEARNFVDRVMQVFHSLEDMTDLRSMYETGKQLSRLYFDCHQHRVELAQYLTSLDYPAFASKMMKKLNNMGVFKNDNIWFSSFYFYNTTWNFSEIWPDFANALAAAGLPNLLNLNIGHQPYLDNLPSKNVYYLVKASLSIIHNIARVPGNVHCFSSENVKSALVNRCLREEEFLRCISDLCLAYIVSDADISLITSISDPPGSSSVLQCLLDHVITAKSSEKRRCHGFQVSEFVSALAALSVNDSIKGDLLSVVSSPSPEVLTCSQLLKDAIEAVFIPSPALSTIREAEEAVRLLWNLSLDEKSDQSTSEVNKQCGIWLTNLLKDVRFTSLPIHIIRALEAISSRFSSKFSSDKFGGGQIVVSFAPINRLAAVKVAERLKNANLPVLMIQTSDNDIPLADASAIGMSGLYSITPTFGAWKKVLDSASILIVCASEAYRLSPGCRQEIEYVRNTSPHAGMQSGDVTTNSLKNIFPVCLQPKYKPCGWLSDLVVGHSFIDLSGRRDLDSGFENFISEVQDLYSEVKHFISNVENCRKPSISQLSTREMQTNHIDGLSNSIRLVNNAPGLIPSGGAILGVSTATSLGKDGSLPRTVCMPRDSIFTSAPHFSSPDAYLRACKSVVRPSVRTWSANKVASWLKLHRNLQILQVTGAFDGIVLSQIAALRFWAPEYFARSLQTELNLSFVDGLRFIEALDELAPGSESEDCYDPQDPYDDRADACSHVSKCENAESR